MDPNMSRAEFDEKRNEYLSQPIEQISLSKDMTVAQLMESFSKTSVQARNLADAAKLYEEMLKDPDRPTIFLGLAGPLIAAGLRKVIVDMIRRGYVDVIVSTGAVMYQDFYQARGGKHYKGSLSLDDRELQDLKIDRIYNSLVDELMFEETDRHIGKFTESLAPGNYSTREFIHELSKTIDDSNSILVAARECDVPIYIPAIADSSIGIGLALYHSKHDGNPPVTIDVVKDTYDIIQIVRKAKATGVVYIGGGVPKNYINDAIVAAMYQFDADISGHKYAIQISTANPFDGGLSGSTFKEATSWGKVSKKADSIMVYQEASIGLPLLVGYLVGKGVVGPRVRDEK